MHPRTDLGWEGEKAPFLFVSSSVQHSHNITCTNVLCDRLFWVVSLTPEGLTRAWRRHGLGPPGRQFNGPPKDMKVTNFFSNFGGRALKVKSKNLGALDLGPLCGPLAASKRSVQNSLVSSQSLQPDLGEYIHCIIR